MDCSVGTLLRGLWLEKNLILKRLVQCLSKFVNGLIIISGLFATVFAVIGTLPHLPGMLINPEVRAALPLDQVLSLVLLGNAAVRGWRWWRTGKVTILALFTLASAGTGVGLGLLLWGCLQQKVAVGSDELPLLWYAHLSLGWNLALLPFTLLFWGVLGAAIAIGVILLGQLLCEVTGYGKTSVSHTLRHLCEKGRRTDTPADS